MTTFGRRRATPRRDWSTMSAVSKPAGERKGVPKTDGQNGAEIIQAEDYPHMMREADMGAFVASLKSPALAERANAIIASQQSDMRQGILEHVIKLEAALEAGDAAALYGEAHEIRGIADTAGLRAAGRIASGFCQYLDALNRAGIAPDAQTMTLHVEAIARAAHATDEATALGNKVADELAALVTRKLAEADAR